MDGALKSLGNHYHGLLPCSVGEEVPLSFSILQASWGEEGGEQTGWRSLDGKKLEECRGFWNFFGSSLTAREPCQIIRLWTGGIGPVERKWEFHNHWLNCSSCFRLLSVHYRRYSASYDFIDESSLWINKIGQRASRNIHIFNTLDLDKMLCFKLYTKFEAIIDLAKHFSMECKKSYQRQTSLFPGLVVWRPKMNYDFVVD